VIEHWDGRRWTLSIPAATGTMSAMLSAVVARSAADAWTVGSTSTGAALGNGNVSSLVQHWDGIAWRVVASPNSNAPGSSRRNVPFPTTTVGSGLNNLTILANGLLFAVGQYNTQLAVPSSPGPTTLVAKPRPWSVEMVLP